MFIFIRFACRPINGSNGDDEVENPAKQKQEQKATTKNDTKVSTQRFVLPISKGFTFVCLRVVLCLSVGFIYEELFGLVAACCVCATQRL